MLSVSLDAKQIVKNMIYNKKYDTISLILLNFRISPVFSSLIIFQNIIEGILPTLLTLTISKFIDVVVDNSVKTIVYHSLLMIIIVMVVQFLFSMFFSIVHRKLKMDLQRICEYEGIKRVAALEYRYIESKIEYENTSRVISSFSEYIYNSYQMALSILVLLIRISGILLVFINTDVKWIGIVIVFFTLPVFFVSYKSGEKVYNFYKMNFENELEMNHQTHILKSRDVGDERTIFEFSRKIGKRWGILRNDYFKRQIKMNKKVEIQLKIPFIISWIAVGFFILPMAHSFFLKHITIGLFISMCNNMIDLNTSINTTFSSLSSQIAKTKAFVSDLNNFISYEYDDAYLSKPYDICKAFETLEFINVSFKYPGTNRLVLNNMSFRIEAGNTYAFIGKNGSGKSTIIKLIIGLYKDYSGKILLNGKNIREYKEDYIKSMFAVIFQDYSRYQISFKENIDIGAMKYEDKKEKISKNRNEAIKRTKLDLLINKLPNHLNSQIGKIDSEGQDISGGEWQRIAIARLLMSESDVFILDEPTSSIDPILEEYLYDFFSNKTGRNHTVIIISHRLGVTKQVDKIFVADNGVIIEEGTHDTLIHNKRFYYDMYMKQKGRFE